MEAEPKAEPAFRRLEGELRSQIRAQLFSADTPLPTEAELARTYDVSRQTVAGPSRTWWPRTWSTGCRDEAPS